MTRWILVAALAGAAPALIAGDNPEVSKAPMAKKIVKTTDIHGDTLADDYFWLRDRQNPEVKIYLEAENAFADSVMKPTEAFQAALYKEMLGRIKETDLSVPYRDRGYFYYSRTEQGKQYNIFCRKKGSLEAPEQVTLDLNEMAKGQRFMAVGDQEVADDGNLLAYTTDNTGFREYRLHVRDLSTGKDFPETVEKVSSIAWAADNKTLFYGVDDSAKRPYRIYRHTLGTDPKTDALVYEEKDEMFTVGVDRSRSGKMIFLASRSHTAGEWRFIPAAEPHEGPDAHRGAREGSRVLRRPPGRSLLHPDEQWLPQLPRRHGPRRLLESVVLEGVSPLPAGRHGLRPRGLFRQRRRPRARGRPAAHPRHRSRHGGAAPGRISRKPSTPSARRPTRSSIRSSSASATSPSRRPPSVYDYDMATKDRKLLKRTEVLGGYDPEQIPVGAPLRDGLGRHEDPDLAGLQEGLRRRRQGPPVAERLRLLRHPLVCHVQLEHASRSSTAASSTPSLTSAAAASWASPGTTRAA